jgi:translation initiation factor IF-3
VKIKELLRVNRKIRAHHVKLIDEDSRVLGEFHIRDAMRLAYQRGFDLVEVAPNARPPVCKLMDFGRYLYEKKRQERKAHKHQHRTIVREMRMSLKISEHDYQVKLAKIKEFLANGDRVKITLRLRGREIVHSKLGVDKLGKIITDLDGIAYAEKPPRQEEKIIYINLFPVKKRRQSGKTEDKKGMGKKGKG